MSDTQTQTESTDQHGCKNRSSLLGVLCLCMHLLWLCMHLLCCACTFCAVHASPVLCKHLMHLLFCAVLCTHLLCCTCIPCAVHASSVLCTHLLCCACIFCVVHTSLVRARLSYAIHASYASSVLCMYPLFCACILCAVHASLVLCARAFSCVFSSLVATYATLG